MLRLGQVKVSDEGVKQLLQQPMEQLLELDLSPHPHHLQEPPAAASRWAAIML